MAKYPLKGSVTFANPGNKRAEVYKIDKNEIYLSLENDIETYASISLTKQEALKLAAQLMCAFDYD